MDHPNLVPLRQIEDLDKLLTGGQPLLLFKHSHTCGVSAEALDELISHLDRPDAPADTRYAIITVQTHRALSNAVAQRFGVRHETPQALLIRGGRVVWSAAHFRVTARALEAALNALPAAQ